MMQTSAVPTFIPVNRQLDKPLELAMQSLTLTGEVTPVGARLQVHHLFRNGEEDPVEVVYAFALPRDGALQEFRIHGEGFSVTSDLVPAKEAQQHYAQAIRKGHLGALVTQHADGLVNLYLGNLRPGETVAVFLELLAGVESLDKGFRFRFPFTLSPVYHAGGQFRQVAPGVGTMEFPNDPAAPLLPRWVAAAEGLHWVACNLHLRLAAPQVEVRSPSHCISVRAQQGGFVEVSLAQGHDLPNRDLILEVEHPRPVTWTACARDSGGKSHVAALLPSTFFGHRREPEARKVVFLLDRSGSMRGVNLMGAKRALARLLTLLREQDVFSVVVFETAAEACFTELLPASEANVELARSFLEAVEAKGGTELGAGLQLAAEVAGSGADLLLLTDGQVGSTDEILDLARRLNLRLWVLGIGSASQDRFLNLLARETGGQSYFLTAGEDLEQAAEQLFGTVFGVLTESLEVVAEGVDLRPVPSPRVFCGRPTILCGEFSGSDPKSVLLRWSHGGQRREEQLTLTPQDDPVLAETLAMVRGARLLTDLDARWSEGGDAAERRQQEHLRGAMEYLSRRYGLASRVMALVGVVERAGDRPGEVPAVRIVPVGMPQDTAFSAYFGDFG
ncbi:MAG: VIT and VWA domain-containing protein [Thermoanaerobaculum sp.]|nr:VIT and VWA domain-containing protein [Thermoanaerobaculum sp.]MDW7967492.1 VIT and VWA domain-containing protein [Thermoanaerobaculum sp.]